MNTLTTIETTATIERVELQGIIEGITSWEQGVARLRFVPYYFDETSPKNSGFKGTMHLDFGGYVPADFVYGSGWRSDLELPKNSLVYYREDRISVKDPHDWPKVSWWVEQARRSTRREEHPIYLNDLPVVITIDQTLAQKTRTSYGRLTLPMYHLAINTLRNENEKQ